jgi:hypothetical protein
LVVNGNGADLVEIRLIRISSKFVRPILEKLHKEGLFKLIAVDLDKNRALGQIREVFNLS